MLRIKKALGYRNRGYVQLVKSILGAKNAYRTRMYQKTPSNRNSQGQALVTTVLMCDGYSCVNWSSKITFPRRGIVYQIQVTTSFIMYKLRRINTVQKKHKKYNLKLYHIQCARYSVLIGTWNIRSPRTSCRADRIWCIVRALLYEVEFTLDYKIKDKRLSKTSFLESLNTNVKM